MFNLFKYIVIQRSNGFWRLTECTKNIYFENNNADNSVTMPKSNKVSL